MQSGESLRDKLLAEVETMAPILTQHAAQLEKLGRLDEPTVETLRKTRLLRFVCPRELGGYEADPVTEMEVLEAVTRIDGSAGWTLGILAITSAFAGAFLPVETAQRIFAKGVPPMAGMIQARGKAEPVTGGYRVTGRWAFGSGIYHADWVIAGAFLPDQFSRKVLPSYSRRKRARRWSSGTTRSTKSSRPPGTQGNMMLKPSQAAL
jgi:alkylation response protein AidB-like acyl-CoA dehydrogenase